MSSLEGGFKILFFMMLVCAYKKIFFNENIGVCNEGGELGYNHIIKDNFFS